MKSRRPHADSTFVQFEREYVRPLAGKTLIVGSKLYADKEDRRRRYADAVGVDMLPGEGVDIVANLETDSAWEVFRGARFAHVECLSVLEHTRKPWIVSRELEFLMDAGSTIFLAVPFIYRLHGYPGDYWRMTPEAVKSLFPNIAWKHLMFAGHTLIAEDAKVEKEMHGVHPYYPRTEVVGFGERK